MTIVINKIYNIGKNKIKNIEASYFFLWMLKGKINADFSG